MNLHIAIQGYSTAFESGTRFDPPPEDSEHSSPGEPAPSDLPTQQYQAIGKILMTAECSHFSVGIPWLPPSSRVRSLKTRLEEPLSEYLRYGLVGVSTKTLESYCDDLEGSVLGCEDLRDRSLFIDTLTWSERYGFTQLVVLSLFSVCLLGLIFLGFAIGAAVLMATLTAAVGGYGALTCSQEPARRQSLHAALYHEVLRRQGLDDTKGNGIRLVSVKSN